MKQNNFLSRFKKKIGDIAKRFKNKNTSFFVLLLCVCLVTTALVWRYTNKDKANVGKENGKENIVKTNDDPYKDYVDKTINEYEDAMKDEQKNKDKEKEASINVVESFSKPIEGTVSREFNMDDLTYYEAIEEWKVHQGLDIKPQGSLVVNCAYDGKVESISKSSLMGIEIVINHGDNVKSKYSCLSSSCVKVGDTLKKGDKLGTLGVIENIEMSDGPHLHFEVSIKDDLYNPTNLYNK